MENSQQMMKFAERFIEQDIGKAVKILEKTPKKDAAAILADMSLPPIPVWSMTMGFSRGC